MANKKLYSLEEAQLIGTKIIKSKSNELKKELIQSSKSDLDVRKITYV